MAETITIDFNPGEKYEIWEGQRIETKGYPDNTGPCLEDAAGSAPYRCSFRVDLPTLSRVTYVTIGSARDFNIWAHGLTVDLYKSDGTYERLSTSSSSIPWWVTGISCDVSDVEYAVFSAEHNVSPVRLDHCSITFTEQDIAAPVNTAPAWCPISAAGKVRKNAPVIIHNGEKQEEITDLVVQTPAGPLAFTRTYRQAKHDDFQTMGLGWTHNHLSDLAYTAGTPNVVEVCLPNGGETKFEEASPGSDVYDGVAGIHSTVEWDDTAQEYTLTAADKSTWVFDSNGDLKSRSWPSGETWTYTYSSGDLSEIVDGYGRKLKFSYYSTSDYKDGQLWRVGDHSASGLDGASPSGRYVEFDYTPEKDDGQTVSNPKALLASVKDARGKSWTYDYYGQHSGEGDDALLNLLTQVVSPSVDTTGDGTADGAITMKDLSYTLSAGAISELTQEKGILSGQDPLLETTLKFQPSGNNWTEEVVAGLTSKHRFQGDVYKGVEDPDGNFGFQALNLEYRPRMQIDANGNQTRLTWSADGQRLTEVADAQYNKTRFDYHSDDTLYFSLDAEGRKTIYVYDDADNPRQPTAILVTDGDDLAVNGDMEDDSDWTDISGAAPNTNERWRSKVERGQYARYVDADQDEGIESGQWDLLNGKAYTITARVYVVGSDTVKMKVSGVTGVETTSSAEDDWETLSISHTPGSTTNDVTLQFLADGGAAAFYIDRVTIIEAGTPILDDMLMADAYWTDISGSAPNTNAHWAKKVNSGAYSRHVDADSGEGIEGADFDLVADRPCVILARVYPVSGTVKMKVSGTTAFDQTSSGTGDWETLYVAHQPSSGSQDVTLQFLADGGAAEFYVDSVAILEGTDILRWQTFAYDSNGRVTSEKVLDPADGSTVQQEVARTYYSSGDGEGLLYTVTQKYPGDASKDVTTTYIYDTYGRVVQVNQSATLGSCTKSRTVYDAAGNVVASICNYDPGDPPDHPTNASEAAALYDANYPDQNLVTTHEYDAMGRRVKTTTHAGASHAQTTQTVYDALGRVARVVQNLDTTGVDGNVAQWAWDTNDGRWEDKNSDAIPHGDDATKNLISDTAYNERGLVQNRRDTLGNVTLYGYDDAGRLVKTVQNASDDDYDNSYGTGGDPDLSAYSAGSAADQDLVTEQGYDAVGNLVQTQDALGRKTFTVYDALNRPVKTVRSAKDDATVDLNVGDTGYDAADDPRADDYEPSDAPDRDLIETTEYDAMGRVSRTVDALGNETRYAYDELGRQTFTVRNFYDDGVIDDDLNNWEWDATAERWEDGGDNAIPHGDDNDRNLIAHTVYDEHGRVLYSQDALGAKNWSGYDGFGRQVKSIVNAQGTATDGGANDPRSSSYSESTEPDEDLITETVYDDEGRVAHTIDVLDRETHYGYDSLGRRFITVQNFYDDSIIDDDVSNWEWDATAGRWEDGSNNPIPQGTDNDRNAISGVTYDAQGRVSATRDSRGNETRYAYDVLGRRVLTVVNFYDDGNIDDDVSNWEWDATDGRWEDGGNVAIPHGTDNDQNVVSSSAYDLAGRVVKTRDAAGVESRFEYDKAGRRVKTVGNYVDGVGESGQPDEDLISETTYNKGGQAVSTSDARGTVTAFTYDHAGRRLTVTQASGTPWAGTDYTCYDKGGRVLRVIRNCLYDAEVDPYSPDEQDAYGSWLYSPTEHGPFEDRDLVTAYGYDAAGRRIVTVQNVYDDGFINADVSEWKWDAGYDRWQDGNGNPLPWSADGSFNLMTFTTYALDGQVISAQNGEEIVTRHVYDGVRRLARVVQNYVDNGEDPAEWVWDSGQSRWEESDGTPIAHGTENDQNVIADVTLDKAGRRTTLTDPRGNDTTYVYDKLNRRKSLTNPLSKTWTTAYSDLSGGAGARMELTDPLSHVTRRDTDRLGRLASISYLSESPKKTPDVTLAYDVLGNRVEMSESDGSLVREAFFSYDDARRLTKVEFDTDGDQSIEQTVSYAYDAGGLRTQLTLPDGKTITYTYDERGQLIGLQDWDDQRVRYAYDLARRLIAVERSNELQSRYTFDAQGRLRLLRHEYRQDVRAQFAFEVGKLGNRTQVTETLRQPDETTDVQTIAYEYDALARLLAADYYEGATAQGTRFREYDYSYDLAGNRTQKVVTVSGTPTTTNYTYNAANQITSGGITYDDAGRMTSDGTNALTWDRANRLLSYNGVENLYNGMGQRVSQAVNSVVTEYLLDVQPGLAVVLAETSGGSTERFVHGPRGIHARQNNAGNWFWTTQDALGSVRGELDASQDVLGTQQFAPYGPEFGSEGSVGTPYNFTGEPLDDNGLLYLRARYLNPGLGVFTSLDPFEGVIQRAMSLNGYSWVEGRVPNLTDPTGQQVCCECEQFLQGNDFSSWLACLGNCSREASRPTPQPRLFDWDDSPLIFDTVPPNMPNLDGDNPTSRGYQTFRAISHTLGRSLSYHELFGLIFAQELMGVVFSYYWEYWSELTDDQRAQPTPLREQYRPINTEPHCEALPCVGAIGNSGNPNNTSRTMRLLITEVVSRQFWGICRTSRTVNGEQRPCSASELARFVAHNVQWNTDTATPEERADRVRNDFNNVRDQRDYPRLLRLSAEEAFDPPNPDWRRGLTNTSPYTWGNYLANDLSGRTLGYNDNQVVAVNYTAMYESGGCPWVLLTAGQRQQLGEASCITN